MTHRSISSLEGPALGGGAELTTACDLRLMVGNRARVQFVQRRMGVTTGMTMLITAQSHV